MDVLGYFDTIHGPSLYGWAFNKSEPTTALWVEAVNDEGCVLATAKADMFRGDILSAKIGSDGRCAYKIELPDISELIGTNVSVRLMGSDTAFAGSPRVITLNRTLQALLTRGKRARRILEPLRARLNRETKGQGISIIMPVYNTPQSWLVEALESVRSQWCGRWELICVDDCSSQPHVNKILNTYSRADPRIRVLRPQKNGGIACSTNYGIRAARYPYVAFMDHDDTLEPDAVWRLIRAIQKTGAELIYSDEVLTGPSIHHFLQARMRPAFSYDYYLSHPYFVHLICVKHEIATRVSGWDEKMLISADVDFVLRVLEKTRRVAHVPAILYRWRTHTGSTGHLSRDMVTAATTAAIQRHVKRMSSQACVSPGTAFNQFHVEWPRARGQTLIVMPTKNGVDLLRAAIRSIERTVDPQKYRLVVIDHESTDPRTLRYLKKVAQRHIVMPYSGIFNFPLMNNLAVKAYSKGCRFVMFLNNDVEAIEAGWLERLTSLAARPDIGAVGPTLLFSDRRIQHAGVIIGYDDAAEHVGKFVPFEDADGKRTLGANCILTSVRDFSAVTAACVIMRRSVFNKVKGFEEKYVVAFNDTDLCLRIRASGLRVLYDGHTVLYHRESATRAHTNGLVHPEDTQLFRDTWGHLMKGADPFYHPALSLTVQDHIMREGQSAASSEPRVVSMHRPTTPKSALARAIHSNGVSM